MSEIKTTIFNKICQLTRVIFLLNEKNDQYHSLIEQLRFSYDEEILKILKKEEEEKKKLMLLFSKQKEILEKKIENFTNKYNKSFALLNHDLDNFKADSKNYLEKYIRQYEEKFKAMCAFSNDVKKELEIIIREKKDKEHKFEKLKEELSSVKFQNELLKNELQNSTQENKDACSFKEKLILLEKENEAFKQKIELLLSQIEQYEKIEKANEGIITDLKEQIYKLQNEDSSDNKNNKCNVINNLQIQINHLCDEVKKYKDLYEMHRNSKELYYKQFLSIKDQKKEIEKKLTIVTNEEKKVLSEHFENEIKVLSKSFNLKIDLLKSQLEKKDNDLKDALTKYDELEYKFKEMKSSLNDLNLQLSKEKIKNEEITNKITEQTSVINGYKENIKFMNKKNHTKNSNSVNINSKKKYTRKLFGITNQNEYETIVPKKNEYDIKNVSNYDRISSKGINMKEVIFTGRGKISIGKPEKLKLSVDDNQDKETIDEIAEHFEKKIEDLKANYREEISHLTYTNILNSNEQKLLYEKEISNLKINIAKVAHELNKKKEENELLLCKINSLFDEKEDENDNKNNQKLIQKSFSRSVVKRNTRAKIKNEIYYLKSQESNPQKNYKTIDHSITLNKSVKNLPFLQKTQPINYFNQKKNSQRNVNIVCSNSNESLKNKIPIIISKTPKTSTMISPRP